MPPITPTGRDIEGIAAIDYATIAALAASALGDPNYATWTLPQLKEWVIEAVQDYATHFQRPLSTLITTTTGTREYSLPANTWWVHRAEHPTDRQPPAYLTRFDHNRTDFTDTDDRYDWQIVTPQTDAKIWISRTPATGEYISVLYSGYWWMPSGGSYSLSLREAHYPLLIQYVVWRAYHERWTHALIENLTIQYTPVPGETGYAFATDRATRWFEAADEARKTYDASIVTAKAQIGKSETARWKMDKRDPIY